MCVLRILNMKWLPVKLQKLNADRLNIHKTKMILSTIDRTSNSSLFGDVLLKETESFNRLKLVS